jgi:hypothetical protein
MMMRLVLLGGVFASCVAPNCWGDSVLAWGLDSDGSTQTPPWTQSAVSVAAGGYHTMALLRNGTVACWGTDSAGQCQVPVGLGGIVQISAGRDHSIALSSAGVVTCWGANGAGQCDVPTDLAPVRFIAGGFASTIVIRADGTVACWGNLQAPKGLPTALLVDGGGSHAVLMRATGSVICWGENSFGQTDVPAGLPMCSAVSAGLDHSAALTTDGKVICWGRSDLGQCAVPSDLPLARDVTAGSFFTTALLVDGTVVGWGHNTAGQPSPPTAIGDVMRVDCGEHHAVVLKSDRPLAGAVEWRRDEGGNGHWYKFMLPGTALSWDAARNAAIALGGTLACLEDPGETQWALTLAGNPAYFFSQHGIWLGGYQDVNHPHYSEPNGGWRWLSGPDMRFDTWTSWFNDYGGPTSQVTAISSQQCPPAAPLGRFVSDIETWFPVYPCFSPPQCYMVEWSNDCDGDGSVDFGQIRAGLLPDVNENNIPDECDCLADIFVDGQVNGADLGIVLSQWGQGAGAEGDINRDGSVDGADLATVLGTWGPCGG